jgi:hypothetical protein
VLTVSVEKLPPPEPKKPKTIQVQVAWVGGPARWMEAESG